MASQEEKVSGENPVRRTRSGRKVVTPTIGAPPTRATRRTKKPVAEEQIIEIDDDDDCQPILVDTENNPVEQTDVIKEMLEEAAQGVIGENNEEDADIIVESETILEEDPQEGEECFIYEEQVEEEQMPQEEDIEMFVQQEEEEQVVEDEEHVVEEEDHVVEEEEQLVTEEEQVVTEVEVPTTLEASGIDEKSSSFPFGPTGGQSEASDEVQNEEGANETGAVESSLLASLAGDNANSLPSVGGGEETDITKKDDSEAKAPIVEPNCEKMESDDSLTEPAIAEDLVGGTDASDATMVNTELVSEDELPLPTKPKINDAEEVSDDELPAPQRAELPPDAEVISEDELPTAATQSEKKSPPASPKEPEECNSTETVTAKDSVGQKRKSADVDNDDCKSEKQRKLEDSKNPSEEQYNPMSPTTESNDDTPTPPVEKKSKTESSTGDSEHKEKKREREKERDREREREREKDKEREREKDKDKEREKEKERKRLPDLDKYWRAVKEDPADFTGWTYLLQYVDNESDAEAAREAYDAFLSHYPYCYGYWRKYADYEKRKGIKANCNAVFERGLEAIPLSVDLWIHYLAHVKSNHADDESYIRSQFERAIDACGLEFRSDKLWDAYIKWENESKRYQNIVKIYDRLLAIPTQGYSGHFDNFQDLINQHSVVRTITPEELLKVRTELRESNSSRSSPSRSKTRRSQSKDKEREKESSEEKKGSEEKKCDEKKSDETDSKSSDAKDDATTKPDEGATTAESIEPIEVDPEADAAANEKPEDLADVSTITEQEETAIKDKIISIRRKLHKQTVAAVTARWTFEEGIKRPYFHVKALERCQLKNWKDYLDFEIEKGDRTRILVLFERCLIACALYDEFWLKMIRYLETQLEQPGIVDITSDVYRRACEIHHPDKPSLHLMWAAFEECQNNFDRAATVLENLEKKCPNLLQVAYRRINVERRRGDMNKCRELYEHYINVAKNKTIAGSLAIKYARFLNKICCDLDGGLRVLRQALDKDPGNTRVALQMIDLVLQRPKVDEDEVVLIMDKFMARENMDPEQKVLFAQRKVEFLEDFGSTAKGLQDAQRALQIALSKANEAKKKRDSSPSRKSSLGSKDAVISNSTAQSAYNNGANAAASNYNYNSANSAYYGQQNSGAYPAQQSYDGYYNHWQYGSGYGNYGQWSGYGNYY